MRPQPLLIAHRGGGHLAAENSLEGVERSLALAVDMIEIDVRRSGDGALVLMHDSHPRALPASARSLTLAELRRHVPHVATLEEAVDLVQGRATLNLDVKEPGALEELLRTVRDHRAQEWCVMSCLDAGCLRAAAELEPSLRRFFSYPPDYGGASTKRWLKPGVDATVALMRLVMPYRLPRMLRPIPGAGATIYHPLITGRLVTLAGKLGVPLYTWTVDDAVGMQRLARMGVAGITTNRPDLFQSLFRAETLPSTTARS